jgi:oligopeptide transport system substrate-binding protein
MLLALARVLRHAIVVACIALAACDGQPWNRPYPAEDAGRNILYSLFQERPKHLDPARSYSVNEAVFTAQIYEPPLQYDYLKRPYGLIPLAAESVPVPSYLDSNGRQLPATVEASEIAYSVYEITIKPGIMYQPHPAFARDQQGKLRYQPLDTEELASIHVLGDFKETGSRELVADDYVYQIKRLAHPQVHSPILGLMSEYIVGLEAYSKTLASAYEKLVAKEGESVFLELEKFPLQGVELVDRYRYRIKIRGKYPQLLYWLAMPFFAPVPQEADRFYSQAGMQERNITLDWYPVGTGPYMLTVNNPNRQMVLEINPNFHGEVYPSEGMPGDREAGLLDDAGKLLPFIDKVVYSLEKETIPYWNKFLQGYYDTSGISSDSFDQAINIGNSGDVNLTDSMLKQGIELSTAVSTSIFYTGFNMLDPVVGGNTEAARKLRQAISIAINTEENISIFLNGRGIPAQGVIPPGIFGYEEGEAGINSYIYDWTPQGAVRKPLEVAKQLLAEAGYPEGRDINSGKPLVLNIDTPATGPDAKARLDWLMKQFTKLNIQLVIRSTDYNRFQDKMRKGTAQIFQWGWNADYPDPENFLFLLYGPNSKVEHNGENASNYVNEEFDRLFDQMKDMENRPQRKVIIREMMDIARYDAPWVWGYFPKQFSLRHVWLKNSKPNLMANNTLKYKRIEPQVRAQLQQQWNQPVRWPLYVLAILLLMALLPAWISYRRQQRMSALAVKH